MTASLSNETTSQPCTTLYEVQGRDITVHICIYEAKNIFKIHPCNNSVTIWVVTFIWACSCTYSAAF